MGERDSTARWAATATAPALDNAAFEPHAVLAGRYEILQVLGEGGMGRVYKAVDREVDRVVALKVVRPDLASRGDILRRFREELILARQVTHHNVVRIYDLGVADGLRYISMEYVDGQDLSHLIADRGKVPPAEAGAIFRQLVEGLAAAHAGGVIHRDLKPKNVMLDSNGRTFIMDFGIARSMEVSDATHTVALVGTPYYMSPEQARGEQVDARSDLYSAGLILYELLTGDIPFRSDSTMKALLRRNHELPKPPHQVDPAIPEELSDIVMKCLATAPENRYQSAKEIAAALDAWMHPAPRRIPWWNGIAAAALLLAAGVLYKEVRTPRTPPSAPAPVSVLVGDFDNSTGDPVLTGTLESALMIALEEVKLVNLIDPVRARRIATQVQPGAARLDEATARLVAVREGIGVVVSGAVAREGGGYQLSVRAVDGITGKVLVTREIRAAGKQDVLTAVGKLTSPLRKAMGDHTPEAAQLAAAETFTAATLEAAHDYAEGQQLQTQGKWKDAIAKYLGAIKSDNGLGRAYAGIAVMYANLNQRQEAEPYFKQAMAHIDRMNEREKYRTRGAYYLAVRNYPKAVEQYADLVKQYPADPAGFANLALAHFYGRNMAQAQEMGRRAIEISPRNVPQRNNVALFALYAGDFETAAHEAMAVLQLSNTFEQAYVTLAVAQLAQGKAAESVTTYQRLQGLGARGRSLAATGLADAAVYEGRLGDAKTILAKAIAGDLADKNSDGAGEKLAALANAEAVGGAAPAAWKALDQALAASKEDIVRFTAARIYATSGQDAKARSLENEFGARLEPDSQAYAKLIEAEILLKHGAARDAIAAIESAQKSADTWLGRWAQGRAFLAAGLFTEADAEFDACLKRRGEATAVFLDDVPTYRYLPPVFYYQGLAREGLHSPGALEAFRSFLSVKKTAEDPLVADARRHSVAK